MSHSEAGKLGAIATQLFYAKEKKRKIEEYNLNPKCCLNCSNALSYVGHKRRKFCSQSCVI